MGIKDDTDGGNRVEYSAGVDTSSRGYDESIDDSEIGQYDTGHRRECGGSGRVDDKFGGVNKKWGGNGSIFIYRFNSIRAYS